MPIPNSTKQMANFIILLSHAVSHTFDLLKYNKYSEQSCSLICLAACVCIKMLKLYVYTCVYKKGLIGQKNIQWQTCLPLRLGTMFWCQFMCQIFPLYIDIMPPSVQKHANAPKVSFLLFTLDICMVLIVLRLDKGTRHCDWRLPSIRRITLFNLLSTRVVFCFFSPDIWTPQESNI